MSRNLTKVERLIEMERLYYLRAYSDEEMGKVLDVDRTLAFRYRKELSAPPNNLEISKGDDGRWKINRMQYISSIRLNRHEALVLYLAARRASQQGRLAGTHLANTLEKLSQILKQPMTERLVKAADDVLKRHVDPERVKVIEKVAQAWVEGRKLRIHYQSLKTSKSRQHIIRPYLIEPSTWSDSVYLIAYNDEFKNISVYKIDRITDVFVSSETFEIPADFDESALLKHTWGIWARDGEPVTVKLRFLPGVATRRLRESVWHPLEEITETEDGGCIWQAPIAEPKEMLPWIRGWGADVEMLEPKSLRKALEREARLLAELYGISKTENLGEQYFAHTKDGEDESEWQLLKDHLQGTGKIAFELGADAGISELARVAGFLHDIGKYSKEFQARLRGSNKRVDHATAGAREITNLFPEPPQKDFAELLSYCIAGHHSGLPDYGSRADVQTDGTLLARREKKNIKNYDAYKTEVDTSLLKLRPQQIKPARFRVDGKESVHIGFSISFLTRMLFSTLTDADWLETEHFVQDGQIRRGKHASIKMLNEEFNRFLQGFENPKEEINKKRTETLHACIDKAKNNPGFFTLTVPTGGGKTFASMAFALNHAVENDLNRIIYVIPFTGIIEQNAGVFRKSLGDFGQENILEHHSNFDWEGKKKKKTEEEANDETHKVKEKLKLAAENWDIPIVVTTNVQFFESLFASKKRSARKLHNIAKSVIIFDEAQMLPREYLKPSLLAVQELVQNYGATAVFCTATQPSLQRFFPEKNAFTELAPNPQELFDFYRRVKVQNLGTQRDEDLLDKLNAHEQALCVVNTRKHAKGLYDQLEKDGSFHLSTLMCPAHRKETLLKIKGLLDDENKPACRVVSTQVMEAGIDVDFPVGYRAMAGLDSIIQAAGRVNREGKQSSGDMFVFNPKTEFIKRTPIFIKQTSAVAESALRKFGDDPTSITAIEAYYEQLYSLQSGESFDAKNILGYFEKGTGKPDFDFKTAAENFKFIENNTVSVIIPFDKNAQELIEELVEKIKYTKFLVSTVRKLQTYTVNIYEKEFLNIQGKGVIYTIGERYHVLDEGSMDDYYHPKTGLLLPDRGSGEAIFFD
jgi:CRISPR-associated endonuclease/helicase Cas3